jgi:protein LTV1
MVTREDFNSILDDFLDKYEVVGKKMVPRLEGDTSEAKLETIRNALGAAKLDNDEDDGHMPARPTKSHKIESLDVWERPVKQRAAWDVQSVLSTYSNLENHPRLIKETGAKKRIQIDPKTGMPVLVEMGKPQKRAGRSRLAEQVQDDEDGSDEESEEEDGPEAVNLGVARSKSESKEEKKARKAALKEQKRSRRTEKKATKEAFKTEENKQLQTMQTQRLRKGVKHIA